MSGQGAFAQSPVRPCSDSAICLQKNATEHASELSLLGWRFFIAVVVMALCALTGISNTTASERAFLACIPVVSLIASSLILKKKPMKIQVAGILITLAGVSCHCDIFLFPNMVSRAFVMNSL